MAPVASVIAFTEDGPNEGEEIQTEERDMRSAAWSRRICQVYPERNQSSLRLFVVMLFLVCKVAMENE